MSLSKSDECDHLWHANAHLFFDVFKYLNHEDLLALRLVSKSAKEISERHLKNERNCLIFVRKQRFKIVKYACAFYENVSSIIIMNVEKQLNELLSIIAKHFPKINELLIDENFLNVDFGMLSKRFPNLRSLKLEISEVKGINNSSLTQMLKNLKKLVVLSVSNPWGVFIKDAILSFPPTLKSLTLAHVTIEEEEFASFLKTNPNLESLHIIDRVKIGRTGKKLDLKVFFEEFIRFSSSIKYFSFAKFYHCGNHIERLNLIGGQTLESIRIDICRRSLTFDESFPTLPKVKTIWLHCREIDDFQLSFFLSRLPNVETVHIYSFNSRFREKTLKTIARLSRLKSLKLDIRFEEKYPDYEVSKIATSYTSFEINNYYFSDDDLNAMMDELKFMAKNRKSELINVQMDCNHNKTEFCLQRALPENLIIKSSGDVFADDSFRNLFNQN